MNYVVDSSLAVKWVIDEPDSSQALDLRNKFTQGHHFFIAPDVFPIEVAHALAKAERQKRIKVGDGAPFLADVLSTMPVLHQSLPLLARAFSLASAAHIGVYDCLYVALAERENCQLVTADDRLIRALHPQSAFIISLASLP